jgi:hypothetical protein
MMRYQDHVNELISRFPRCSPNEASSEVFRAVKNLYQEHDWTFLIAESSIVTEAAYTTGTVGVTNGNPAIALTDGTWVVSWANRRIVIEGDPVPYGLTVTGAAAGTLDRNFSGETDTGLTYTIYRDIYTLPTDCDYTRAYYILDPARNCSIRLKDYGTFMDEALRCRTSPGIPAWATFVSLTSDGVPQIQLGPNPPSSAETYPILYFRSPATPSALTEYPSPRFPVAFEDLIWRRAAWQYAENPRHPHWQRSELRAQFYERFFDAVKRFDGGNEIDRRIRSSYPTISTEVVPNFIGDYTHHY